MFLLDLYETLTGAGSLLVALVLFLAIFKVAKGIVKTVLSLLVLGLVVVAILAFVGII